MKRLTLAILTIAAVFAVASTTLTAQAPEAKIVFVDSQTAINAHPAGQKASELQAQAKEEVDGLRADLDALSQKARGGTQLTAAEQERYQTLLTTLDSVQTRYQADIQQAAQPAIEAVNTIIQTLAQENGYTIVLDAGVASNGLVVYAQDGLDITPLVLERIRAGG